MHGALRKLPLLAALGFAAMTLAGCIVEPAPYYGDGYYAQPAPAYIGPTYYYGPRYHHWPGHRWHGGHYH
jgi:hypothetical protein